MSKFSNISLGQKVGIIMVSLACAVGGYFIPIEDVLAKDDIRIGGGGSGSVATGGGGGVGGGGGKVTPAQKPAKKMPAVTVNSLAEISVGEHTVKGCVAMSCSDGFLLADGEGYLFVDVTECQEYAVGEELYVKGTVARANNVLRMNTVQFITQSGVRQIYGHPKGAQTTDDVVKNYVAAPTYRFAQFESILNTTKGLVVKMANVNISLQPSYKVGNLSALGGHTLSLGGYFGGYDSANKAVVMYVVSADDLGILVSTTPVIVSGPKVAERDSHNYKKVGVKVTVKAETESGDPLSYVISDGIDTYTSSNGVFPEIKPNDTGVFVLTITNKTTGESIEKTIKNNNLKKVERWGAAKIEEQLKASTKERLFKFHFDPEVKIDYVDNTDGGEATPASVSSLDVLSQEMSAWGWKITVYGNSIKYDKYNRITYMKIQIDSAE